MEIDETCLSNSYKSMNDFFEEMELDKTVDIRQLTEVYGFSARWIQKVIKQKERRRVHG